MNQRNPISNHRIEEKFLKDVNRDIGIVHRVCNSFFDPEDAEKEDLFQEIMYQLWKSYSTFQGDSKFSTWMYRVAFNTAIMYSRKRNSEPDKSELEEINHPVGEADLFEEENERIRLLYSAIRSLKEIDRVIILLHLEDQSYSDISKVTGLTKTNISVRLVRIRRQLKTKLQKHKHSISKVL
jgi:RNA polymerase sigma-70 factor, ECF subfamily